MADEPISDAEKLTIAFVIVIFILFVLYIAHP